MVPSQTKLSNYPALCGALLVRAERVPVRDGDNDQIEGHDPLVLRLPGASSRRPPVVRPAGSTSFALAPARPAAARIPEREAANSILKHHNVHLRQTDLCLPCFFRKGNQVVHVNPYP